MEDQGIGCGGGWRGRDVEFGPGSGMKRGPAGDVGGAWERWWDVVGDVDGTSVECRWNIGGMSCTEKWRDRGYDGDVNRSKVQEIWG